MKRLHSKSTSLDIAEWTLGHYADLRDGGLVGAPRKFTVGARLFLWCAACVGSFVAGVLTGMML